MRAAVVADLGGTFLRTGIVTPERVLRYEATCEVGDRRGNAAVGAILADAVRQAHEQALALSLEPAGIGLAVPGLVDPARGILRYSGNLDVRDLPITAAVREAVPLPVVVENDVRAAAWGEWMWGAGRGTRDMIYLSAGTGIAAAVVIDGHLYRGATGAAGEVGHAPVVADGDVCRCGQRGCLETVAAGWGIARRAGMPTAEAVFTAAAAGHAAGGAVIMDAGRFLGQAAVIAVRLWDPERLVLGGGLFYDGSPLLQAVRKAVAAHVLHGAPPPAIEAGAFGGRAGLIGAACLVLTPS